MATGEPDNLAVIIYTSLQSSLATALFFFQPPGVTGSMNQIFVDSIQPCSTKNLEFLAADQPDNLSSLIHRYSTVRLLFVRLVRDFPVDPESLESFKRKLKTELFKQSC